MNVVHAAEGSEVCAEGVVQRQGIYIGAIRRHPAGSLCPRIFAGLCCRKGVMSDGSRIGVGSVSGHGDADRVMRTRVLLTSAT